MLKFLGGDGGWKVLKKIFAQNFFLKIPSILKINIAKKLPKIHPKTHLCKTNELVGFAFTRNIILMLNTSVESFGLKQS